ncbi:hypothetical protein HGA64_02435 [Candidatus Falkowbacteria bacterium]|nr:hypothetical protein [Candidatus Falkowbacteria bacterium]
MNSNKKLFVIGLVFGTVVSLGLFFSSQSILAVWTSPTADPTSDNVAEPVNIGPVSQYKPGHAAGLGLDRLYSDTTESNFYVDSQKGLRVHLDTNGDDANNLTGFEVVKDDNTQAFSVNENGVIYVNGVPLVNCSDGKILYASSTSPNGLDCSDGLTYGP